MSLLTGAVDKRLERANYKNVRQEGLRAFYDDTGQLAAKGDYTKDKSEGISQGSQPNYKLYFEAFTNGYFRWKSFTSASSALQPGQVPALKALDFVCPSQPPVRHLARPLY